MLRRRGHTFALALLLFVLVQSLIATPLAAQIIIDPPPGGPPPPLPLPAPIDQIQVERQQVDVVVDGPLAQVHLTQILRNDSVRPIEGTYLFPLPENAAIGDFQMTVNGEVIEGELLHKEEARRTYEEIVRQRRDPALLEYLGRDLFQVSVFPIPAGETRTLELSYSQILTAQDGLVQLRYPLETRQFTSAPIEELSINIELVNQPGLRTIYSPTFAIATTRLSDSQATVTYAARTYRPEGDFTLYFGTNESAIGVNLLSYQPAGNDGYFVLLAAPSVERTAKAIVQRDIVLVVDVSGSMSGDKLQQAIGALHYVVDQLNPDDRFNLIAFSTGVKLWQSTLQAVTPAAQEAAHRWIDHLSATGSTDMNRALLEALAQLPTSVEDANGGQLDRPAYVLFLTDGLPTQGERDSEQIIANVFANRSADQTLRLFTFGVGYDVNTTLLDTLSGELGGRSSYVRPEERIDEEVGHFYQGISAPVLSDVMLDVAATSDVAGTSALSHTITIDDLYPYPLPDLFAGEQLVIAGRYHLPPAAADQETVSVQVTLRGKVNGATILYRYPGQHVVTAGGEAAVARLWAARKIGTMLQQIRRSGPDPELIDAIIALSLEYGIVTPYTSSYVPEPVDQLMNGASGGQQSAADAFATPASAAASNAMDNDVAAVAAPASQEEAAAVSLRMQQVVGADAVAMSETIGELQTGNVAQRTQGAKYVAGRTFVPQPVIQNHEEYLLTRWIDTRYNERMQVQPVLFGSDCYFAMLSAAQSASDRGDRIAFAEWLSVAPELILVLDDAHALLITTELDATQAQTCPTITGALQ